MYKTTGAKLQFRRGVDQDSKWRLYIDPVSFHFGSSRRAGLQAGGGSRSPAPCHSGYATGKVCEDISDHVLGLDEAIII